MKAFPLSAVFYFAVLFVLTLSTPQNSVAQSSSSSGKFGAGFSIGSQGMITAKKFLSGNSALDAGLAFGSDWNFLFADHLWIFPTFLKNSKAGELKNLDAYIGLGGGVASWSTGKNCGRFSCSDKSTGSAVFARIPLGVTYEIPNPNFEFYLEIAPALNVVPATTTSTDVALGFRFYF